MTLIVTASAGSGSPDEIAAMAKTTIVAKMKI
jgi:hypothetical protein